MYFLSLKLQTFFWIYCYDINCSVINCTQSSIKSLNKNWSFPLRIFQVFQVSANLVIFTEEILNEKLYFLYSEWISVLQLPMRFFTSFFKHFCLDFVKEARHFFTYSAFDSLGVTRMDFFLIFLAYF